MRNLSRAEQVKEILRCGRDPIYFIKTYVKIRHPIQGIIPFKTYPYQDDCLRALEENRLNIVLKARQLGLSTVTAAYAVHQAIFKKDQTVLVIATKLATAMNFIKKVKVALDNLPKWLLLTQYADSKQQISFANGSSITSIPTSEDAGRSEALSLLIVDEAAWIKNFEEIWTGLKPTISTGGRVMVLSTPNGAGGLYYQMWIEAEAKTNGFNPIRLQWWVHPEHDEAWFAQETKGTSKRYQAQEYLCDFLSSGDSFCTDETLEYLRSSVSSPVEKWETERNLWIWRSPRAGKRYIISGDVARGDAADYSTLHVIEADELEVVAEYLGKMSPDHLAVLAMDVGKHYNTALIAIENNTFGFFTNTRMKDLGYRRLYYKNATGDPFTYMPLDDKVNPGFQTDNKSRPQILTKLEEVLRNKSLKIYSQRLYDQIQAFHWNGQRAEAMKGCHDDLVMSLAIGSWILSRDAGVGEHQSALAYAMLGATRIDRRDTNSLPINPNSVGPVRGYMSVPNARRSPYSSADPAGQRAADISDMSWLYR